LIKFVWIIRIKKVVVVFGLSDGVQVEGRHGCHRQNVIAGHFEHHGGTVLISMGQGIIRQSGFDLSLQIDVKGQPDILAVL